MMKEEEKRQEKGSSCTAFGVQNQRASERKRREWRQGKGGPVAFCGFPVTFRCMVLVAFWWLRCHLIVLVAFR